MKSINTVFLLFFTSILLTAPVLAGTVTGLKSFTKGTPAVSADVNGNFNAIKTAVDDNDQRITTLEKSTPGTGDLSVPLTGIVNVVAVDGILGLTRVAGVGTKFTEELRVNTAILIDGQVNVVVKIIDNATLDLRDSQLAEVTGQTVFIDGDLLTLMDSAGQVKFKVKNSGELSFPSRVLPISPVKMRFERISLNTIRFTNVDGNVTELVIPNNGGNGSASNSSIAYFPFESYVSDNGISARRAVLLFNISSSPSLSCTLLHSGDELFKNYMLRTDAGSAAISQRAWGNSTTKTFMIATNFEGIIPIDFPSKFEIICF